MLQNLKSWQKILITLFVLGIVIYVVAIILIPLNVVDFRPNYVYATIGHLFLLFPIVVTMFSQKRWVKITFFVFSLVTVAIYIFGFFLFASTSSSLIQQDADKLLQKNPSLFQQCEKYGYGNPEYSFEGYRQCQMAVYQKEVGPAGYTVSKFRDMFSRFFVIPLVSPYLLCGFGAGCH